MSGVEERLSYLEDTKELLRQTINENGGDLLVESPFSDYPEQLQHIVDTSIVPQSKLDSLIEETLDIINFNYLDNITTYRSSPYGGLYYRFPEKLTDNQIIYNDDILNITFLNGYFSVPTTTGSMGISYSRIYPIKIPSSRFIPTGIVIPMINVSYNFDRTQIQTVEVNIIIHRGSKTYRPPYTVNLYWQLYDQAFNIMFAFPEISSINLDLINNEYYFTQDNFNVIKNMYSTISSIEFEIVDIRRKY